MTVVKDVPLLSTVLTPEMGTLRSSQGLCLGPARLPDTHLSPHSEQADGPNKPQNGVSQGQSYLQESKGSSHFKESTQIF